MYVKYRIKVKSKAHALQSSACMMKWNSIKNFLKLPRHAHAVGKTIQFNKHDKMYTNIMSVVKKCAAPIYGRTSSVC